MQDVELQAQSVGLAGGLNKRPDCGDQQSHLLEARADVVWISVGDVKGEAFEVVPCDELGVRSSATTNV